MFASVIFTTYNHPKWLEKTLWGFSAQSFRNFEIIVADDGSDERMQYGGQDREFGERLVNMGIKPRQVRYRCSCVHLDHGRGYARPESIAKNRDIRKHTRGQKITRIDYGIEKSAKSELESS